jgi:tripartite-type tricarboxylate transporter receptor subunit TctC
VENETSPPHILASDSGAAALPPVSRIARAQVYPTRPVRIIVGFAAGSASDPLKRRAFITRIGAEIVRDSHH